MICRLLGRNIKDQNKLILKGWNSSKPPYHTGLDISADVVYNVCKGVVIFCGVVDGRWSVILQVNANICIRYSNLLSVSVDEGQPVFYDEVIGTADKYVHFEYCTISKGTSKWPIRAGIQTYYKQDPSICLDSNYFVDLVGGSSVPSLVTDDMIDAVELDMYQLEEFSDGRGEFDVELWTR